MSVAQSSSGMLTIGCIAYWWEGGDGSAQRGRSVILHSSMPEHRGVSIDITLENASSASV